MAPPCRLVDGRFGTDGQIRGAVTRRNRAPPGGGPGPRRGTAREDLRHCRLVRHDEQPGGRRRTGRVEALHRGGIDQQTVPVAESRQCFADRRVSVCRRLGIALRDLRQRLGTQSLPIRGVNARGFLDLVECGLQIPDGIGRHFLSACLDRGHGCTEETAGCEQETANAGNHGLSLPKLGRYRNEAGMNRQVRDGAVDAIDLNLGTRSAWGGEAPIAGVRGIREWRSIRAIRPVEGHFKFP